MQHDGRKPALGDRLTQLYARTAAGVKFDLEVTRRLLDRIGNPQSGMSFVHVAGTNGKGSVCAMIESVCRAAGFRTGLYTSPHLVKFNERIRVAGRDIEDAELVELFNLVDPHDRALAAMPDGREATFFELTTVMALEHFRRSGVKLAVLETGMGGRLDATNVVTPLVSVITRIGIEHREFLGDTLEKIAAEKAGIIKPGVGVVCGAMDPAAREVIERTAAKRNAPFIPAEESVSVRRAGPGAFPRQKVKIESENSSYPVLQLPLAGSYQLENVATAVAALEYLGQTSPFSPDETAVKKGLESVSWPGRCQLLSEHPPVVLDVAHNPDAARALAAALRELAGRRKVALVLGLLSDKDGRGIMAELAPLAGRCLVVPLHTPRAMRVEDLLACARQAGVEASLSNLAEARAAAVAWAREHDGVVCIAGSLYLAGEVLAFEANR
ncbi:MAG: Folylpolyglutamate synthase [Verrucomicrobia bacterium ADurb.Bin345]|nr:MAG: Folylpolyglutamate synthase [Verrucomicrobia bacterium ADurb.Bin345]